MTRNKAFSLLGKTIKFDTLFHKNVVGILCSIYKDETYNGYTIRVLETKDLREIYNDYLLNEVQLEKDKPLPLPG